MIKKTITIPDVKEQLKTILRMQDTVLENFQEDYWNTKSPVALVGFKLFFYKFNISNW